MGGPPFLGIRSHPLGHTFLALLLLFLVFVLLVQPDYGEEGWSQINVVIFVYGLVSWVPYHNPVLLPNSTYIQKSWQSGCFVLGDTHRFIEFQGCGSAFISSGS